MTAGGLCHWGPICALTIILELFVVGLYCDVLLFHPLESVGGFVHLLIYIMWLALILNYFLKSVWIGPGYVPRNWKPAVSIILYLNLFIVIVYLISDSYLPQTRTILSSIPSP